MLGAEWRLRAFDVKGEVLWQRAVPGTAWAVNTMTYGGVESAEYPLVI